MNHPNDNEIEALLRKQFDGSVPDDGFTDRMMLQLPRRHRPAAWPLLAGIIAGTGGCWLSLLSTSLLHIGWQDLITGELSASAMIIMAVVVGMSLLACLWTMMEAEDH